MIDPPTNPLLCPDAGIRPHEPKLCARRLHDGKRILWCAKPDLHWLNGDPDCQGVSRTELPAAFAEIGPKRVPRWGK